MRDHLHDPGEHQLLDRVDVAGDARHQVAELTALEEPERHPVQVGEQAGAQAQDEPLPDPGAQVVVDERQQPARHRDADIGRGDQREQREVAGGEHVVDEDLEDPDPRGVHRGRRPRRRAGRPRGGGGTVWSGARSARRPGGRTAPERRRPGSCATPRTSRSGRRVRGAPGVGGFSNCCSRWWRAAYLDGRGNAAAPPANANGATAVGLSSAVLLAVLAALAPRPCGRGSCSTTCCASGRGRGRALLGPVRAVGAAGSG